jgi:hypothetical protein
MMKVVATDFTCVKAHGREDNQVLQANEREGGWIEAFRQADLVVL